MDEPAKDMNELAERLTKMESGEKELNIADVKEVLACLKNEMKHHPLRTMKLLAEYSED